MPWSTRELADLAGTTVNTVRHYHRLGLLQEPERRENGYKLYGTTHLVRLLRLRRLTDLGVPLARIAAGDVPGDRAADVLREVDAELAADVERLQRARADIAAVLREDSPADAPAGFEPVARHLSEADTSLLHVYARLYDDAAVEDLRRMAASSTDREAAVDAEVDALPADADEATRRRLAEALAPVIARHLRAHPWLTDPGAHLTTSEQVARRTTDEALADLYNPAQLDVRAQAHALALALLHDGGAELPAA